MTNLEQLLIRACKSKNPLKRLVKVRNRFFLQDDNYQYHLMVLLADICEKYAVTGVSNLAEDLNPSQSWRYGVAEGDSFHLATTKVLCSKIRLSPVHKFEGLTAPAKLRNWKPTK